MYNYSNENIYSVAGRTGLSIILYVIVTVAVCIAVFSFSVMPELAEGEGPMTVIKPLGIQYAIMTIVVTVFYSYYLRTLEAWPAAGEVLKQESRDQIVPTKRKCTSILRYSMFAVEAVLLLYLLSVLLFFFAPDMPLLFGYVRTLSVLSIALVIGSGFMGMQYNITLRDLYLF